MSTTSPPPVSTLLPYTTLFRSVLRGCGPKGYPGMPEVSNMPLPAKLLEQRSEEHTSELQSRGQLVCRLLLEKQYLPVKSHQHHERKLSSLEAHHHVHVFLIQLH